MAKRKKKLQSRTAKKKKSPRVGRKPKKKALKAKGTKTAKKPNKNAAAPTIMAWDDDPKSGRPPASRPVPNPTQSLKFKINDPAVAPGPYAVGTKEFRYWTAADALRRCSDFWTPLAGISKWHTGSVLPVTLDKDVDLNAYYDRQELAFFHGKAKNGTMVYSGESPDIVCHEMGHALLDAHQPLLWDTPFIEVGSFHEFLGDASAILSALQLPNVASSASAALKANKSSFLSRLAEQLGWAIGTISPGAVDSDCLRNACNAFKYIDPETLPDSAPASKLCAEVHSFSRVFAGSFYEILSGMANVSDVATAAEDIAKLLLAATAAAPVDPHYFAQVAAHMVDADTALFAGKYRKSLTDVFVDRDILPAAAVKPLVKLKRKAAGTVRAFAAAAAEPQAKTSMHKVVLDATVYGLAGNIVAPAPIIQVPHAMAAAAVTRGVVKPQKDVEAAAAKFVAMLFAHGRVEMPGGKRPGVRAMAVVGRGGRAASSSPKISKLTTHTLVKTKEGHELKRLRFLCGCSREWQLK